VVEDKLSITSTAEGLCCRISGVAFQRLQQFTELDNQDGFLFWQPHQIQLRSRITASVPSEPTIIFARLKGSRPGRNSSRL